MQQTEMLNQNREFLYLYKKGSCFIGPLVVLYVKKNRYQNKRLGVTVGKKIGKAVVRNRAKRIIRESYRINEHSVKNGYDIVIVARNRINGKKMQEVEKNLIFLLKKAGLYQ